MALRIETVSYPSDFANTYFLITDKQVIVIDPGSDGSSLAALIKNRGYELGAILLTHGHFDHINGAEFLQKEFKVKAYIHEADLRMIDDPRLNGADMFRFEGHYDIKATSFYSDEALAIDDLIIRTIHTPFHTPGSVCYYLEGQKLLFTGDTLFKGSIGRSDLPLGSFRTISPSLAKLQTLPPDVAVYPGHGPKTTIGAELTYNRYFKIR